jgi:hypothetical protein
MFPLMTRLTFEPLSNFACIVVEISFRVDETAGDGEGVGFNVGVGEG